MWNGLENVKDNEFNTEIQTQNLYLMWEIVP